LQRNNTRQFKIIQQSAGDSAVIEAPALPKRQIISEACDKDIWNIAIRKIALEFAVEAVCDWEIGDWSSQDRGIEY